MLSQKVFFDSMAEKWDTVCFHDPKKINHVLDLMDLPIGAKCLDVGTGTGVLLPFLTERIGESGRITAIDLSERMLEVARRKYPYPNVSFICGNVLDTGVLENNFDFVICYSVFPHFPDQQNAVHILSTYLKKGGKLLICHSQGREEINSFHAHAAEAAARGTLPDSNTLTLYLEAAGLKVIGTIDSEDMYAVLAVRPF